MIQKALIVEPSRLYQNIISKVLSNAGVRQVMYSSAKQALEDEHSEYTFIITSRELEDISGEIFIDLFGVKHGLSDATTILITASEDEKTAEVANKAGFKYIINKKNLDRLEKVILIELNRRIINVNYRILYIEDSQSIAELAIELLKSHGAKVDFVTRLDDLKQKFDENDYDLVISDYYLENDETGDDVVAYIREYNNINKSETAILILSGEDNQTKRASFLRNGADDYISKPWHGEELLLRASNLIKSRRTLLKSKKQQRELEKLALTDHLTGLYNRHSLYDVGPKYVSNAKRHQTNLSLLVIDLDHFKKINDTRGHSVGDMVLKSIAGVLKRACRTEDVPARFGGEEFIMLLSNCDLESAMKKAESIRLLVEKEKPEGLTVTASIGVAELDDVDDFNSLFEKADKAVYTAKETGRNKVVSES
ncbi:MAG: diguanylate cyclase [Gammaproteobacteria bacterium]|nr:diguanylate cyclase [Gammaproteobacteria bacterium]MDH5631090.1 diguanylate cyclase [Gammaproteobacteria bacterium]